MRSHPASLLNLLFFCCACALSFQAGSLEAADTITVHLKSGRTFTGYVDSDTTKEELVLRFEDGRIALWRPIQWERVVGAEYQGKKLSPEELRSLAPKILSATTEEIPPPPSEAELGEPRPQATPPAPPLPPAEIEQPNTAPAIEPVPQRVRSIDVRAELANWNNGVEMDGLILTIWPLDGQGQIVPVSGTVEVQLEGLQRSSARSQYLYARGNPFPLLGQWTQAMQADQVGFAGAQFKLPFQAIHPEFNTDVSPYGMVLVRLAVPGHGTFAATANLVRIRPFSPLRDVRQQLHLNRFFPQEQLTRTQ